jgi:hypothetical protein
MYDQILGLQNYYTTAYFIVTTSVAIGLAFIFRG